MIRSLLFGTMNRVRNAERRGRSPLRVEALKDRCLLSIFEVTTVADSGPGSLRQAILDSNATPGTDTIAFAVGGGGVQVIQPTSALPPTSDPVVIDGATQPGFAGSPLIVLNGSAAGAGVSGLTIQGGDSTVQGLAVNGFAEAGILLSDGGGNVVVGNYLGTDASGASAVPNGDGIRFISTSNNRVGGTTVAERNVISGNTVNGVNITTGSLNQDNLIQGNYIGTTAAGTAALGNLIGVEVGGPNNTIGGTAVGAGNLISANVAGLFLDGDGNVVQGNLIGTDATGSGALGNGFEGVGVFGSNNVIGGTTAAARNVISANPQEGLLLDGDATVVQGNYIGTDAAGAHALGNGSYGIRISSFAFDTTIGGTAPGAGNVISGNLNIGIFCEPPNTRFQGNLIGTDATGTQPLGNRGAGIDIEETFGCIVGGTDPAARNVISANGGNGIEVFGRSTSVQGNYVGTDITGTMALGNLGAGVLVQGITTVLTVVGGTDPGAGNLISGNVGPGVNLLALQNVRVQGNRIGTDVTGTAALGNQTGVQITNSSAVTVGGAAAAARNIISGNQQYGILLDRAGTATSVIQGNWVGLDGNGAALGNGLDGVRIQGGARNNTVGGPAAGAGNVIAFNGGAGVAVTGTTSTGNSIRGNSIVSNAGLGIDLAADGVTPNDPGDIDSGPNLLQNFPELSLAVAGATTQATGALNSAVNTTFTLDFYASAVADPSGFGEGARYLGSAVVTTDGSGNARFVEVALAATAPGEVVTATATNPAGNTSEFSPATLASQEVAIDIKPDDAANEINLKSNGNLPVAVLTTADFDATTVDTSDLSRLRFGDVNGTARVSPVRASRDDVDGDGNLDLVLIFSIRDIRESGALTGASTEAELTGFTTGGAPFRGTDMVHILAGPRVVAATPAGTLMGPVDRVTLTFNEAVQIGTFTLADVVSLTGPAGSITPTAVNRLSDTVYEVRFAPQTGTGDYALTIGPHIADLTGSQMDQDGDGVPGENPQDRFTANFSIVPFIGGFDFGVAGSPVADGYTAVTPASTYSAAAGFGWLQGPVEGVDRGIGSALTRDLDFAPQLTFGVDVPAGVYDVTLTIGDPGPFQHDLMAILLEGAQVDTVSTLAGQVVMVSYHVAVKDGQLTVNLQDRGGADANVVINGLQVTWISPTGPRVVGTSPSASVVGPVERVTLTFDEAILDGSFTLADVVSLTGPGGSIAPLAVNRLSPTSYEVLFAPQSAIGDYSLVIGPAIADLTGNLMDQDGDGVPGEIPQDRFTANFSIVPFVARFDFGVAGSPVADGYTAVTPASTYSAAAGFGWLQGPVEGVDRGIGSALTRDLDFAPQLTFGVDVPAGVYDVTLTIGDPGPFQHDLMAILLEGAQVDTISTSASEVRTVTYHGVQVTDGQLTLRITDQGGFDANAVINGLEVLRTGSAPAGMQMASVVSNSAGSAGAPSPGPATARGLHERARIEAEVIEAVFAMQERDRRQRLMFDSDLGSRPQMLPIPPIHASETPGQREAHSG